VRYSSTSNKGLLFCSFEVCQASCQAVTPGFRNLGPLPPQFLIQLSFEAHILNLELDHEGIVASYLPKFCSRDYFTINYIFIYLTTSPGGRPFATWKKMLLKCCRTAKP
jgi:hypothetical protein